MVPRRKPGFLFLPWGSAFLPLLLFLGTVLPACTRKPGVDPNYLKSEAGKAAFDFYKSLNNGQWEEAGLYFSRRLRAHYPDPLSYPLVLELKEGKVDQLFPGESEVNLHDRSVILEIAIQKAQVNPGSPPILVTIRREKHRWIWENDNWYFDGAAGKDF